MNAIQTIQRVLTYSNLTAVPRLTFAELNLLVNDSVIEFVNEEMGDEENRDPKNFQWIQRISDNLFNLIKKTNPTVTPGTAITNRYYTVLPSTFPFPADYDTFVALFCLCDGFTDYAIPTTWNKRGPLLKNSFKVPTNRKIYFNQNDIGTGMEILRSNSGTFTSATLTYIKFPTDFSMGAENQIINPGGVLTNLVNYYATEVAVYNGVTFQIGATITGTGAALTSGSVILVSNTSPIDLPVSTHEFICKKASQKLLATIGELDQSAAIQDQVDKG